MCLRVSAFVFFFFADTATTEIYTLSLHDALPILPYKGSVISIVQQLTGGLRASMGYCGCESVDAMQDRKSTRLNSSHLVISYAVFCLKKKKNHLKPLSHPAQQNSGREPSRTQEQS